MTIEKRCLSLIALLAMGVMGGMSPRAVLGQDFSDDFMFHEPKVTLSFSFGYGVPSAGSDLFDEVTDVFTLGKSDFHAPRVGGGVALFLNDRVDLAFEFSFGKSSSWSEYVDWVDDQDFPIEQETAFTQVPVTVSLKYFLMDRGRKIGNLSWISSSWAPYIGVGGGRMYYEFEQTGDFVDFVDYSIFWDSLVSSGWAWTGHVFGGVQWAVSPQWIVTAEGRYSLGETDLDRSAFSRYEPIDLSGFQGTIGFGIRF